MDTLGGSVFERAALVSRLLTREQLNAAWAQVDLSDQDPSAELLSLESRLANKLVEMGWINRWQAQQLLAGRSKFNLGPYWIVDSIGRGGMGQVFKARDELLDRIVAVKVLPRSKSTPEAVANFKREIEAQSRLCHPNLVRAIDSGEDGKVIYLVTEYVPGADLRKLVRSKGPMTMERAASIIAQAACGLQHAHEQGLVHRDVKPGNILVTPDGVAKLSDLGLAGPLGGDVENDPRFGRIVGTADFLSPDHIEAPWQPTPAWDIYSLGCTLYYAVTGKVPFPGGSTRDKANAHLRLRPLDPRRLNPNLTAAFVEVLADMMAKDPEQRIPSAAAVVARLRPWVGAPERVSGMVPGGRVPGSGPAGPRPGGPVDDEMDDTESGFPDLPEAAPGPKENTSQASQVTHPVASAGDATASRLDAVADETGDEVSMLRPLAVFVGFPLALVGAILAIGGLVGWLLERGGP
ncbi:MAG: serine/threonine protein kinase [Thermoguttaceae bacterium]|nr:serine/threonine protein kinase [Thermoguttaceae bacterium]